MPRRAEKFLKSINQAGLNANDIREDVLDKLKPYFCNLENLKKYIFDSEILSAYSYFIAYQNDDEFSNGISQVLEIYNSAYNAYPDKLLNMFVSILEHASQKENQMYTVAQNLPNLNSNDFYDKAIAIFKNIGDSLEISVKYIVVELYSILMLTKKGEIDYEKIKRYEFGVLIQGILDQHKLENVLKLKPHNLKLSDWRNIAYHHTYTIIPDRIKCEYGKNKAAIEITMSELEKVIYYVARSSNVLNIARCIFAFDNLPKLQALRKQLIGGDMFLRKDILIEGFKVSLLSQGFDIVDLTETENDAVLSVCDLKNNGSLNSEQQTTRIIHSSQFLYHLWRITKAENLKIIYNNNSKKVIAEASIKSEIFNELNLKDDDSSSFASYVYFAIYT